MEQLNVCGYVGDVAAHSAAIAITNLPGVGHVGKLEEGKLINSLSAMKNAILHLLRNKISSVPRIDRQIQLFFCRLNHTWSSQ
jgi:proteasome assembly chaperone (PAC2) family protein